jgi:class 3 adenylate cyclase
VLATSTVRELVIGSTARFTDAGEHSLEGIDGTWHLYALDIGEQPIRGD